MNKTRKVGLAKRRKDAAKLNAKQKQPAVPQKGPRAEKTHEPSLPTLALLPKPRR